MAAICMYFTALLLFYVIFCIDETAIVLRTDEIAPVTQSDNSLERNIQQLSYPCEQLLAWAATKSTQTVSFILYLLRSN